MMRCSKINLKKKKCFDSKMIFSKLVLSLASTDVSFFSLFSWIKVRAIGKCQRQSRINQAGKESCDKASFCGSLWQWSGILTKMKASVFSVIRIEALVGANDSHDFFFKEINYKLNLEKTFEKHKNFCVPPQF